MTSTPDAGALDPLLGQSAGNYQLVSQLGMGGMGAVYLARHAMLGRPAAVKVLLPELSQHREIVTRFFNEAKAATAIRLPSIVEIYDFGFLPSGNAYIIMELLEGESLGRRLERLGSLPFEAALVLVRQTAGALHAAHERQIVHRDLKPDNLFVVRDPEIPGGERIKLLDFGIAKLASEASDNKTRTGTVMGTPAYMSPEQCRGVGTIDCRTDLYALGCILYELLCGRPPFVAEGSGDIIAHHLYFAPEPPRRHQPAIPEGVEALVMWLLQKDLAARPASAAEVIAAIDQLAGQLDGPQGRRAPRAASQLPMPMPASMPMTTPMAMGVLGASTQLLSSKPTTLGGAAAERSAATVMVRVAQRWRRRLAGLGGGLLVLGAVAWWFSPIAQQRAAAPVLASQMPVSQVPAPSMSASPMPVPPMPVPPMQPTQPVSPVAAAPPVQVSLVLESEPSGVEVWLEGERVGVTPFTGTALRGAGSRTYVLRRVGLREERVEMETASDAARRVVLQPHERAESSPGTAPALQSAAATPTKVAVPASVKSATPARRAQLRPRPAGKPNPAAPTPSARAPTPAPAASKAAAPAEDGTSDGVNPFE